MIYRLFRVSFQLLNRVPILLFFCLGIRKEEGRVRENWMDSGGGTGAPEQDSGNEDSDALNEHIQIVIESLPVTTHTVGIPPNQTVNVIHTLRIRTAASTITIQQANYVSPSPDFLLLIAEEVIRSGRSRLRRGVVQITRL